MAMDLKGADERYPVFYEMAGSAVGRGGVDGFFLVPSKPFKGHFFLVQG